MLGSGSVTGDRFLLVEAIRVGRPDQPGRNRWPRCSTSPPGICVPNSLSQDVTSGLGAQAGPGRLREVFTEAGLLPLPLRLVATSPLNMIIQAAYDAGVRKAVRYSSTVVRTPGLCGGETGSRVGRRAP